MYVWEQKISRAGTMFSKGLLLGVDISKGSKNHKIKNER